MDLNLIALDTFPYPYGGGPVRRGQKFQAVSEADAQALVLAGKARVDDGTSDVGAIVEKRKYKTRQMTADT